MLVGALLSLMIGWQPAQALPVASPQEACSTAISAYATSIHEPLPTTYCDPIPVTDSPEGYYVLALRSGRKCRGICSDLMGWFAVRESTGDVLHWNVGDQTVGRPIDAEP